MSAPIAIDRDALVEALRSEWSRHEENKRFDAQERSDAAGRNVPADPTFYARCNAIRSLASVLGLEPALRKATGNYRRTKARRNKIIREARP